MSSEPLPPEAALNPAIHDAIARRAYDLWEREGSGHGSHERHWLEAERQLHGDLETETAPSFPPREAGHPVSRPD